MITKRFVTISTAVVLAIMLSVAGFLMFPRTVHSAQNATITGTGPSSPWVSSFDEYALQQETAANSDDSSVWDAAAKYASSDPVSLTAGSSSPWVSSFDEYALQQENAAISNNTSVWDAAAKYAKK
jgi:hypothetical protein